MFNDETIKIYFHLVSAVSKSPKSPKAVDKTGKKPRVWDLGGNNRDIPDLDRSKDKPEDAKSDFTPQADVSHRSNSTSIPFWIQTNIYQIFRSLEECKAAFEI